MKVKVYEVSQEQYYKTATELKVSAGLSFRGKEGNDWFKFEVFVLPHDKLILAKTYYCDSEGRYYLIENEEGKLYAIESIAKPVIVKEGKEFYEYVRDLKNIKYVDVPHGLGYCELYIVPREFRRKFEAIVLKEFGEVAYRYSSFIPFEDFIAVLKQTLTT